MSSSLRIRPAQYRGRRGFAITGRSPSNRPVRVFALTAESAVVIRDKIRAGQRVIWEDFAHVPDKPRCSEG